MKFFLVKQTHKLSSVFSCSTIFRHTYIFITLFNHCFWNHRCHCKNVSHYLTVTKQNQIKPTTKQCPPVKNAFPSPSYKPFAFSPSKLEWEWCEQKLCEFEKSYMCHSWIVNNCLLLSTTLVIFHYAIHSCAINSLIMESIMWKLDQR